MSQCTKAPAGLLERRLAANLSRERLARLADVSTTSLKVLEGWSPGPRTVAKIDAALTDVEAEREATP